MILTTQILFQMGNKYAAIKPLKDKHIQFKKYCNYFLVKN